MSGFSIQWLILFVDVSLKSVLVALIAAAGLKLLRVRDSNLRHRVWTGVLCGMLLLPLLTQIVPALRLPFSVNPEWFAALEPKGSATVSDSVAELPHLENDALLVERENVARDVTLDNEQAGFNRDQQPVDRFDRSGTSGRWPDDLPGRSLQVPMIAEDIPATQPPFAEKIATPREEVIETRDGEKPHVVGVSFTQIILANLPLAILSVWLFGLLILVLRLLAGLWVAHLLWRASRAIDSAELLALGGSHRVMRPVPVLVCPLIRVPLTLGILRPQILLPSELAEWSIEKLQAVLVHEQTHADRGDCALALLAEVNCCLYWFHPLAWWLRRHLAGLAETACDDAAIGLTGDRASYARHLLEVAATARAHRGRLVSGSVSMARCSSIESRINSILDFTRPLSQQLTRETALVLMGIIIPLIAIAAALQPSTATNDAVSPVAVTNEPEPEAALAMDVKTASEKDDEDIAFVYAGTVVDPDDKPVAGAKLFFCDHTRDAAPDVRPLAITRKDGSFSFARRPSDFDKLGASVGSYDATLVATADGFGFAIGFAPYFESTGRALTDLSVEVPDWKEEVAKEFGPQTTVLKLVKDGVPVRMQLVDIEGQPVKNAKLEVLEVWLPQGGNLDDWEHKAALPGTINDNRRDGFLVSINGPRAAVLASHSDLDQNGWTQLSGLGQERMAKIQVTGSGIESAIFYVRTRPGETIRLPRDHDRRYGDEIYHPAEFTHAVGRSQPVIGRITDAKTGEPVSGCVVQGHLQYTADGFSFFQFGTVSTFTDSTGSYRLDGLAPSRREPDDDVIVLPPRGSAYVPASVAVKVGTMSDPVVRDVPLFAGVRIHGTVTDAQTGRPIAAAVKYSPFSNNSAVKSATGINVVALSAFYYQTDTRGRFEIPVLPGKGVLGVQAFDNTDTYPAGVGLDAVRASAAAAGADIEFFHITDFTNLATVLDLPEGTEDRTLDLTMSAGRTIKGTVVSPDGDFLSDYLIFGGPQFLYWMKNEGETFKAQVHSPSKSLPLYFYHPARNLIGKYDPTDDVPDTVKIVLKPAGVIKGRIVDQSGLPLEGAEITNASSIASYPMSLRPDQDPSHGLIATENDRFSVLRTASDGRFEIRGIFPGLKYSAVTSSRAVDIPAFFGKIFTNVTVEPGEVKDLGDVVPDWNTVKDDSESFEPSTGSAPKSEPSASIVKGTTQGVTRSTDDVTFTYAGTVVDPQGRPVAGAMLILCYDTHEPQPDLRPLAVSASDGSFRFSRRKSEFDKLGETGSDWRDGQLISENYKKTIWITPHISGHLTRPNWRATDETGRPWLAANLVATADGFGFAVGFSTRFETSGRLSSELAAIDPDWRKKIADQSAPPAAVLQLAQDDVPVRFRIVNIEGQAVPDVKLEVIEVWKPDGENMKRWERMFAQAEAFLSVKSVMNSLIEGPRASVVIKLTSPDANGWRQINGLGQNRIARVQLTGPGIESSIFHVRTRNGETLRLVRQDRAGRQTQATETYYATEFTHVAGPSQPVTGRITDSKTGVPLSGCVVEGQVGVDWDGRRLIRNGYVKTLTDSTGQYRLEGLTPHTASGNPTIVVLPSQGSANFATTLSVPIGTRLEPVVRNAKLPTGIRVRGIVTDARTGEPIAAKIRYLPFSNNSHAEDAGFKQPQGNLNYDPFPVGHDDYQTDYRGRFEIPALPGKGILKVTACDRISYWDGTGLDIVNSAAVAAGARKFIPGDANLLTLLDLAHETDVATVDLKMGEVRTFEGTVESPDGQILSDYLMHGGSNAPSSTYWTRVNDRTFKTQVYFPTTQLLFYDPAHNLIGKHDITREVREKLKVVLKPGQVKDLGDEVPERKTQAASDAQVPIGKSAVAKTSQVPAVSLNPDAADVIDDVTFVYAGTVVDPDGKPVAGAKIALDYWRKGPPPVDRPPAAISDERGRFEFSRKISDFSDRGDSLGHTEAALIATKEDFGFAAGKSIHFETTGRLKAELSDRQQERLDRSFEKTLNVLSLVNDDIPIHGRILNGEGQPVAGAKIEAVSIWGGSMGSLDDWEAAAKKPKANYYTAREKLTSLSNGHFVSGPRSAVLSVVFTDAAGWFLLKGLGRDRIAETFVSGPGIETAMFHVRSRTGDIVTLPGSERSDPKLGDPIYYPAEFTRVVGPSVAVQGHVTDSRTKRPLAGVVLKGHRVSTNPVGGTFEAAYIRTVTNADGSYQLVGLPLGKNELLVLPPLGSRHLPVGITVNTLAGSPPLERDVGMTAGILAHGQVVDERTQKPLRGHLEYFIFNNNPHLKEAAGVAGAHLRYHYRSDGDGQFEIPVLPGKGILAFTADDHERFPRGAGADQIDAPSATIEGARFSFRTVPYYCLADNHHLLASLDPVPGAEDVVVNLRLKSGVTIPGSVFAQDGQPLNDYRIYGASYGGWRHNRQEAFEINAYLPNEGRRLTFYHPGRNLAAQHTLTGEPPQKLEITLLPAASLVGRVVDADGTALVNVRIEDATVGETDNDDIPKDLERGLLPPATDGKLLLTDAQGRFEIKGIIPGLKYSAEVRMPQQRNRRGDGAIFTNVTAQPGETKDLGDLRPEPEKPDVGQKKESNTNPKISKAESAATSNISVQPITFAGTVVDEQGRPVPGAKVSLSSVQLNKLTADAVNSVTSDARGEFHFTLTKGEVSDAAANRSWSDAGIVAVKDGYGFAWGPASYFDATGRVAATLTEWYQNRAEQQFGAKKNILTLMRDDVPVRGRILNGEGQPVAGAKVAVVTVWEGLDRSLDAWEAAMIAPNADTQGGFAHIRELFKGHRMIFNWVGSPPARLTLAGGNLFAGTRPSLVPTVQTDADGWFVLKALGRERIAEVLISGPGIESTQQLVRSRQGSVVKLPLHRQSPDSVVVTYYPSEFTFVCGTAVPITGRITDAKTGKPLAGIGVQPTSFCAGTVTDAEGNYRIDGLPIGSNNLLIIPPTGSSYLAGGASVETTAALQPVVRNIKLTAGILVRGQVIDERTGAPVQGRLEYFAHQTNSHVEESDSLHQRGGHQALIYSNAEGRFEIPVLPGPGILGFFSGDEFPRGVGAEKIDCPKSAGGTFLTLPTPCSPLRQDLVVAVNPPPDENGLTVNLTLRSGFIIPGRVLAPDGQPVTGYQISGTRRGAPWGQIPGENFKVSGYFPTETRRLTVFHLERNLATYKDLTGPPPERLELTLRPAATLIGRALDAAGTPLANTGLWSVPSPASPGSFGVEGNLAAKDRDYGIFREATTDAQGRFEIKGIIPGLKYTARVMRFGSRNTRTRGMLFTDITAESSETKDLGDLRPIPEERARMAPKPNAQGSIQSDSGSPAKIEQSALDKANAHSLTVHGIVLKPDEAPASNAHVAIIGRSRRVDRGGDLESHSDVLGETTTDEKGRYEITLTGVSSKTHLGANVIARSDGFGLAWRPLDPDARDVEMSFELAAEQVIRGRLIDIQGMPAADVRLSVSSVVPTSNGEIYPSVRGVGYQKTKNPLEAWPSIPATDDGGRFEIRGIPAGHGVYLDVAATDLFAPQGLAINTGMPEERQKNDGTYRSLVRNFKPDEEAVLALAPAQIFEGVVRYADTNEPAPHARLTIWASQQEVGGSMISVPGKADALGRYRINPNPGVRFGITAYPPNGVPYLIREERDITHKDSTPIKRVDISLPRGVLIRGCVVESDSKSPVVGAVIQYVPERSTAANAPANVITGWQGIQISNDNGAFEIAVLPGPGTLLINGPNGGYVTQEIGSQQLSSGSAGGERNYAHAFHRLNPATNSDPLEVTIELRRGAAISGRITNRTGEPVKEALLVTRLNMHPMELSWRGFVLTALGGRFELSGLADGVDYPVHFLDARNRLGATAMLKSDDKSPTVVLLPCGEATATFIDKSGKPIPDYRPTLEFVMTTGSLKLDLAAMRVGLLAADSTFVANIDRTNYWSGPKTAADGRIALPALIPGGRYRIYTFGKSGPVVLKEFVAESQKTLDLGKITIDAPSEE